jgi:hypothetical protein
LDKDPKKLFSVTYMFFLPEIFQLFGQEEEKLHFQINVEQASGGF